MKMRIWATAAICGMILPTFSAPAWSGEESGGGTATYAPASIETMQLADGGMVQRSHIKGIVLSNDTSNAMHLVAQDCFGTTLVSAAGEATGKGYCDAVDGDSDGDRYWLWWHNSPKANKWGFMGGTGKFEGVKGGGTTTQLAQMADGRSAITWEGTWTMK